MMVSVNIYNKEDQMGRCIGFEFSRTWQALCTMEGLLYKMKRRKKERERKREKRLHEDYKVRGWGETKTRVGEYAYVCNACLCNQVCASEDGIKVYPFAVLCSVHLPPYNLLNIIHVVILVISHVSSCKGLFITLCRVILSLESSLSLVYSAFLGYISK